MLQYHWRVWISCRFRRWNPMHSQNITILCSYLMLFK
jgi:hypothetical protein